MKGTSRGKLWGDPGLLLFNALALVLSPVLLALKARQYLRRRDRDLVDPDRWRMPRMSTNDLPERSGFRLVFVGGSFGELKLMESLARAVRARLPGVESTYALRDREVLAELRRTAPAQRIALWPFDALPPVARFLRDEKPDLLVFTERYRFTNLVRGGARVGARSVVVNGRFRQRDSLAYRLARPYYRWFFAAFDAILVQDEPARQAAERAMPGTFVRAVGDVKLDLPRSDLAPTQAAEIAAWTGADPRPLVAAGSTHSGAEEAMVLTAFEALRRERPCRLLLAPRRAERGLALAQTLREKGMTVSLRSCPTPDADVLVLDTIGELAYAYRFAKAAYVGGALEGMGHNVIEPVQAGIPVAYGPRRGHFEALQRLCEEAGVGFRVEDADGLAEFWSKTLGDGGFREESARRCAALVERQGAAFEATVELLVSVISGTASPRD